MPGPNSYFHSAIRFADPEKGFNVWCYATQEPLEKVLAPRYFQSLARYIKDGDLLVINVATRFPTAHPVIPGHKVLAMCHKDRSGAILTTKLLELPHDPVKLAELLTRVNSGDPEAAQDAASRQSEAEAEARAKAEEDRAAQEAKRMERAAARARAREETRAAVGGPLSNSGARRETLHIKRE